MAYAINQSRTLLLPRWIEILEGLAATTPAEQKALSVEIMPCDESTRWNSTYEMLSFAYLYREAIDIITGDHAMKLRGLELAESEWESVEQLCDSLSGPVETWMDDEWKIVG